MGNAQTADEYRRPVCLQKRPRNVSMKSLRPYCPQQAGMCAILVRLTNGNLQYGGQFVHEVGR